MKSTGVADRHKVKSKAYSTAMDKVQVWVKLEGQEDDEAHEFHVSPGISVSALMDVLYESKKFAFVPGTIACLMVGDKELSNREVVDHTHLHTVRLRAGTTGQLPPKREQRTIIPGSTDMDPLKKLETLMTDLTLSMNNLLRSTSDTPKLLPQIQTLQQNMTSAQATLASVAGNTTPKPKKKRVWCTTTWKQFKYSYIRPTWQVATVVTFLLSLLGFAANVIDIVAYSDTKTSTN
eukprot:TRINITY_DN1311_c0_g1_i1.p1 TRINITY_DN1311_c0_g1~~TRINITY_DN1311_c0_g1_i1.p1  ORF type:complete len:235 (+),score=26.44 TRINITY_DN1311_c0_g1_i1:119-823(+)